ncbi:MAG: LapA family protein, partial [Oceanospirillaceae bacterium]|nr:LapA family protein [Oceanospirillaceae bacterium]
QNPALVHVSLFNFESAEVSLGLLLILVFGCGAFFAVLMNLTWYTRVLLKQRRLNRALQQSLKRVEHIRQP